MAGKFLLKSSALAALAIATATIALPGVANAEPGRGHWDGGERGGGDRGDRGGDRREQARPAPQQQQQAPQQQQQQRPQPAQQGWQGRGSVGNNPVVSPPQGGNWQGRGNADNAPRWGSQRPADGQHYGRDRQSGAVNRPAPAWRGATPAAPDRGPDRGIIRRDGDRSTGWTGRNPTYNDQERNRTYRDDNRDGQRDGSRNDQWRGRNDNHDTRSDRNRTGTRDSYRRDGNRSSYQGDYRRWNNDWRRDQRYNWSGYRNSHRDVYRVGRYYSPYRGYNYSRIGIGIYLDSLFYSNNYWISDPWQYRLPDVYGPYRWVRYYDDVLLVDIYSGEVVDVIYDFFD